MYSTCTPNPIEDEAVVAELLLRCKGALELLDVSDQLPELKRCPGKRSWMVRDKHQWYKTWEEAEKVGWDRGTLTALRDCELGKGVRC